MTDPISAGKQAAFRVVGQPVGRYSPTPIFPPAPSACPHWISMVAMKVRSCVLVACMLVVPALALFSHLMPPTAREFMRSSVCDPICQVISAIDASLPFGSNATLSGEPTKPAAKMPVAGAPLVAIAAEPVVPAVPASPAGRAVPAIEAVFTEAVPPVTISQAEVPASPSTEHDAPRSQAEWATLATLRKQLTTLGATGIDCRPQPGTVPGYTSSCRLGIDADGQLHRMFHGRGPDAPAAMQSLVNQIQAWQMQQAGGPRQRF